MIPTSFTGSSPPTGVVGGSFSNAASNSPLGSSTISNNSNADNNSALLGIASLILEGRALAEDEYVVAKHQDLIGFMSGVNAGVDCGRQSPKPSTSRAAASSHELHCTTNISTGVGVGASSLSLDTSNYLRRKASNSPESSQSSSSLLRDYYSNSSSESAGSSVESNHSRWTQKLSQLRQESPSAHRHQLAAREQKIAVECMRSVEPEYVALAINTDQSLDERRSVGTGDFEIIRRIALNRMNMYNSPVQHTGGGGGASSGGSMDNFMCSLQSLASNTCLRVGTPILSNPITASTPKYPNYRLTPQNTPRFPTPQHTDVSAGSASSSGSGGIPSPMHTASAWYPSGTPVGTNNKDYLLRKSSTDRIAIPTPQTTPTNSSNTSCNSTYNSFVFGRRESPVTASMTATAMTTTASPTTSRNSTTSHTVGPHCDQFLRKMGLAKGDASEAEEHHCDMSYVNITCTRWRAYCIKMENILVRGEPLCIEVYLGPVGHKILLEQWIITVNEKQPPPTMTLPSLCSAIRSQLYFSQISAWCDLIKKSDKNIYDTGRFIFTTPPTTSAAGDLATTTGNVLSTSPSGTATTTNAANTSSSSSHSSSGVGGNSTNRKAPRLNIFYRIKTYDNNSACFNSKPNVHNFPNVNVSENSSVSVCLKSLPRISGGIPKVGPVSAATANTSTIVVAATTESSTTTSANTLQGTHATTTTRATAAGSWVMNSVPKAAISASTNAAGTTNTNKPITKFLTMNCDNKDSKEYHQQQQQTAVFNANYLNRGNSHPHDNDEIAKDGARHDFPTKVRSQALGKLTEEGGGFGGSVGDDDSFNGDFESCGAVAYNCDHAGGSGGGGVDGDSSNSSLSTNFGNLSHREKQLLKYRKRMLKRDKKHQQQRKTNDGNVISQANEQAQKMEQGEDDDDDDDDREEDQNEMATMSSRSKENETDVKNTTKGQRQQQLPNSFINSIPSKHGRRQQEQQQHVKMISTGTQTTITNNASTTCSSCGFEKSMICLKCNPLRSPNAAASIIDDYKFDHEDGMDVQESPTMSSGSVSSSSSSACSLSSSDIIHTPRNKAELLLQAIQRTPKSNKKLKITKDLQHHHKEQHTTTTKKQTLSAPATQSTKVNNNNGSHSRASPSNTSISSSSSSSSLNGSSIIQIQSCQVCKRQKTQHNFQQPTTSLEATSPEDCSPTAESKSSCTSSSLVICSSSQSNGNQSDDVLGESENETDGGKMSTTEDCVDNVPIVNTAANCSGKESCDIKTTSDIFKAHEVMEEEYFVSSTKLTPNIERCSLTTKTYYSQLHQPSPTAHGTDTQRLCSTPPLLEHYSENAKGHGSVMAQFKTPTPSEQQVKSMVNRQVQQQPHKQTPKPNLLQIAFSFNGVELPVEKSQSNPMESNVIPSVHNPLLARRNSPKVNLTRIFCNPTEMKSSSPIPIGNGVSSNGGTSSSSSTSMSGSKSADIQVSEAAPTFSFETPSGPPPSITVQKSNSAPTLPNSPSLSPRFIKASALYKRRSRHLSDRSDRSSLGSDEQFSDEDIDCGMYSPFATSPVKLRTRLSAVFGRKPLLGNLEENLLQRRLVPKIEVMGFKLLLGASGGFCPTQLTIPAAAYFYELKGETLSTPYSCEIRLPRKGYSVPRCGTVQATLLNPMGTVVRMFVIPYDMRDMPALHQTFVRQRILADTGNTGQTKMSRVSGGSSGDSIADNNCDGMVQNGTLTDDFGGGDNATINSNKLRQQQHSPQNDFNSNNNNNKNNNNNSGNMENHLGHFISAENMKSLRYSIHLRFQTSRSGRLMLHTDIRLLISRRTDCDTAAAHAKGVLEAPNELITNTVMPTNPKYSARQDQTTSSKI